jgi:hypothetical protein
MIGHGGGKVLTLIEAMRLVAQGADNVMVQRDMCCDDPDCACTPDNPCWFGIQKGDEFQPNWEHFELW